jgi:hypothetical protein
MRSRSCPLCLFPTEAARIRAPRSSSIRWSSQSEFWVAERVADLDVVFRNPYKQPLLHGWVGSTIRTFSEAVQRTAPLNRVMISM